jgi:hypothetical protein
MISKAFDWYGMLSPKPRPTTVEARTKAATELIPLLGNKDKSFLLALCQGVSYKFQKSPAESETIALLLRTLKQHDSAVSEDLSKNQLELQYLAALILGELLSKAEPEKSDRAILAASALVSALGIRPLPKQLRLRKILDELSQMAMDVLENAAGARRRRHALIQLGAVELAVSDLAKAETAVSRLQEQVARLERNADIDREEINLFWFIATGISRLEGKAYSSEPIAVAAVHAALDFSHVVLTPATPSSLELLRTVLEMKRKHEDLVASTLADYVSIWTSNEWDALAGQESAESNFCSKFPAVFPLSWIGQRSREARSGPNWTEFERLTHLKGELSLKPFELSHQVFREKTTSMIVEQTIGH